MRETISRNRPILTSTVRGFARGVIHRRAELRHHVVREAWTVAKRFAAESVENIEFREIPCLWDAMVEGYLEDQQRLVLGALARGLGCRTGFEIGTNRGRTAWSASLDRPIYHVFGTRMAIFSRQDFVRRLPPSNIASIPAV